MKIQNPILCIKDDKKITNIRIVCDLIHSPKIPFDLIKRLYPNSNISLLYNYSYIIDPSMEADIQNNPKLEQLNREKFNEYKKELGVDGEFFGGEENSNTHARAFMNTLNEWVSKENKTLILIHHSKKPGNESNDDSKIRGAGAIVDASRLSYEVKSISLKNYVDDYRFFTGSRYNAFAPKISENDTSSDNYHLAMDAIMTHRRILIAKDNLGVRMFMKNDCNKSNMFYRKAWGEVSNFSIDVESGSKLSESDMHFLTSDVEVVIFDEDI